ncbi:hypothetical protein D6T63_07755 [Arthrobacter cheniae]|uniref:Uncharacterized protein n=1 Tax=Arthrobacter cheniae TaxID=1258888 RepID=A0A3A5MFH3_9MICC|nr:hypothetical protein [Arthrobacter cheniae]RJT81062.1 hypothetical protein D6T63_07755 [Arthrobacter cheniae]
MSDAPQINPQSNPQINELGVIIGRTRGFLLTEQTAQEAVNALAEVARDVITGAEGAGVSLIRDGDRTSVGATDAKVLEADNLQYTLGGVRACTPGRPTSPTSLLTRERTPAGSSGLLLQRPQECAPA